MQSFGNCRKKCLCSSTNTCNRIWKTESCFNHRTSGAVIKSFAYQAFDSRFVKAIVFRMFHGKTHFYNRPVETKFCHFTTTSAKFHFVCMNIMPEESGTIFGSIYVIRAKFAGNMQNICKCKCSFLNNAHLFQMICLEYINIAIQKFQTV